MNPETKKQVVKYIITAAIWMAYFKGGIVAGLLAPALVDFKYILKTSMDNISFSYTFIFFGYLCGSLFGFIYKFLDRDITFIVMTTVMVLSFGAMPFVTHNWMLYLCSYLTTLGSGAFDCGTNVWIIELWGEKYEPILHSTQMMFGLATILGPVFMTPFVKGDVTKNMNNTLNDTERDNINYAIERRSELMIPFLIAAGITLLVPITLICVKVFKKLNSNFDSSSNLVSKKLVLDVHNVSKKKLSDRTRNLLILLVAICLNCSTGLEHTHLNFSATFYQNIPIHLSAQRAAQVLSVMSTAFTFGRIFSIIASIKFKPDFMICVHIFVICVALMFIFFGQNSETYIFIGNALIGFGNSALWPLFFAFTEQHLKLTDNITSIFLIVSMTFPMSSPFIVGPFIEKQYQIFVYLEFLFLTILIFLTIITLSTVKSFNLRSLRNRHSRYDLNDLMFWQKYDPTGVELKNYSYTDSKSGLQIVCK